MSPDWLGRDRESLAVDRILDAAGAEYSIRGVHATTMADIAAAAGCSRATLYNYFGDRRTLDVAFIHREAIRLAQIVGEQTSGDGDPHRRAADAITLALDSVRNDPRLAAWFSRADVGLATALSSDSEVLDALAGTLVGGLDNDAPRDEIRRRARWVVRAIVSLLSMPPASADEERQIIEDFVVPPLWAPVTR